ncbi:MAG: hypothetical protein GC168_18010 [Candidatus Hydrogenedens sp.]|nr:hypothetical protein [Candidatus Hydrogenedens sp.]
MCEPTRVKVPERIALQADRTAALQRFEAALNPARPEAGGARVIGYGEISTAFTLADLPGFASKRMAGFSTEPEAERYGEALADYLDELHVQGVRTADTRLALLTGANGRPMAYLVQPLLDAEGIGAHLLRTADDGRLLECVQAVLETVAGLLDENARRTDDRVVAVDAQLSNWWFEPGSTTPTLLDVGTPFMRRGGIDECGTEFFLAPVPFPLRGYYRRQRAVEQYIDDYFDARSLALDLLGNFHKEGRPDRIGVVVPLVNDWLAGRHAENISARDVDAYYKKDAADLELYLKIRRLDRALYRLAGRSYPFILPGPIKR